MSRFSAALVPWALAGSLGATSPSQSFNPNCGLLWWRTGTCRFDFSDDFFRELEAERVAPATVQKRAPLQSRGSWGKLDPMSHYSREGRGLLGEK